MFLRMKRTKLYYKGVNKPQPKRLNWDRIESVPRQEGRKVVKGTGKRIVVVKSPDQKFFEQAIFILKEDILGRNGESSPDVLREAQKVADDYVKSYSENKRSIFARIPPAAYAGIGACATAVAWLIIDLV